MNNTHQCVCKVPLINIVNVTDDIGMVDRLLLSINSQYLIQVMHIMKSDHINQDSVGNIDQKPIRLVEGRFVWCNIGVVDDDTNAIINDLIIYPTGSFVDDIVTYSRRVLRISENIKKEVKSGKYKLLTIPGLTKTDIEAGSIQLTIPLLVSILLTRFYDEKDEDLLEMAQTVLLKLYQL